MNPYHFSEISRNKNNKHFQLWLKAVQAKYDGLGEPFKGRDFDQILWNYDVSPHISIPPSYTKHSGGCLMLYRSSDKSFLSHGATDTDIE